MSDLIHVILSAAKLQRSGQSPRGQAFNLRLPLEGFSAATARDFWKPGLTLRISLQRSAHQTANLRRDASIHDLDINDLICFP
jgi:hypothetical protein